MWEVYIQGVGEWQEITEAAVLASISQYYRDAAGALWQLKRWRHYLAVPGAVYRWNPERLAQAA